MRRHLAIATLVPTLFAAAMWGQMRGGARGGMSMGRSGFVPRGPVMVNRGPMMANRGTFFSRPRGAHFGGHFRGAFFDRDRFFFDGFHHGHRFFFGLYPFFSGFYPWYDAYPAYYGDYSYLARSRSNEVAYDSLNAENTELANTIARLSDEVAHLREEQEAREALPRKPEPEKNPQPPEVAVLVFRDKHTQEVTNYAIVGSTLWILNEQRATKVPLATIDIDATTKLNEERGVEFRLPK